MILEGPMIDEKQMEEEEITRKMKRTWDATGFNLSFFIRTSSALHLALSFLA